MSNRSRAKQDMINVISSIGDEWPITLLYMGQDGADIKIEAGKSNNREEEQLTLAAMYLLFLEGQLNGNLYEVAEQVAGVAEEMRDHDNITEFHWGGSLEDPE